LQIVFNFLKQYATQTYNTRSDICVITGAPDKTLSFQTSLTEGLVPVKEAEKIRGDIGANLLSRYGLPRSEDEIPVVLLLLTPTAVMTLGKDSKKFIKEWTGESKVGDLTVVKYCVK